MKRGIFAGCLLICCGVLQYIDFDGKIDDIDAEAVPAASDEKSQQVVLSGEAKREIED